MGGDPKMDSEMAERVIEQAYDFWIGPEIERRRAAGQLPDGFALHGAQVILGMDEGPPEVRLNDEVKAVAEVIAARAIAKGEQVTENDIAGYTDILLTDADPDAGHIAIVAHKGHWALAFDFRRNASRISEHSDVSREFLHTATWARERGYIRPFVDKLFSATELMAKGMLIWQPDRSLLESKTHSYLKVRFNLERKHHNVDARFVDLVFRSIGAIGGANFAQLLPRRVGTRYGDPGVPA